MNRILVTGFEPFGGEEVNPSWRIAEALAGEVIGGHAIEVACLPCEFGAARAALAAALARSAPALVLLLGQAGGRTDFSLERIAINVDDARIADNAGCRPVDEPVVAGGPAAYFSTLPIKAIVAALRDAGLPASVSQTAGTFVCNHTFYGLMHTLAATPAVRGGFMHVPFLPEQAARRGGTPSLPLAMLIEGTRIVLRTALLTTADIRVAEGALD
jgi:pyroglutamyl-peptidase